MNNKPIKSNRLLVLLCFVTMGMILGCSPKSSSQVTNIATNDLLIPKRSLTFQDPFSGNLEWAAYRESIGMYALHLKPSVDLMDRRYEVKIEEFMDGKQLGELLFDGQKLGFFRDAMYDDSCLHFYAFRRTDTLAYAFQFSPKKFITLRVDYLLDKKSVDIYRWVALFQDSRKVFELKDSAWMPIFSLTLPYKELCTPNECFYCVLPENVNHYQDWGKTMKIKHYVIFSIRFL